MSKGNGRLSFHVVYSEALRQRVKELLNSPALQGSKQKARDALTEIQARLRHDPRGFGEPLYTLGNMSLHVRLAVHGPFMVSWAVHQSKALVSSSRSPSSHQVSH